VSKTDLGANASHSLVSTLERLLQEATPAFPNRWVANTDLDPPRVRVLAPSGVWVEIPYDDADAELIAKLRNHAPALLRCVRAAQRYRQIALNDPTSLDRPTAGAELDRTLAELEQDAARG
jgi:hypothetical protein